MSAPHDASLLRGTWEKENAHPNPQLPALSPPPPVCTASPCASTALPSRPSAQPTSSSKAQLISARLAEWKRRIGAQPPVAQIDHASSSHTRTSEAPPAAEERQCFSQLPDPRASTFPGQERELTRAQDQQLDDWASTPDSARRQETFAEVLTSETVSAEDCSMSAGCTSRASLLSPQFCQFEVEDEVKVHEDNDQRAGLPEMTFLAAPTFNDVTEDNFDFDLSMCGDNDTPPIGSAPTVVTEELGGNTSRSMHHANKSWKSRYEEEHAKLESLQALLRDCERDLESVLRQHEQYEQERQLYAQNQTEFEELKNELLAITESFTNLKKRYDETKVINENLKRNEASLLATLSKLEEERIEAEARFNALRAHAEEKLVGAAAEVRKAVSEGHQAVAAQHAAETALNEQMKLVAFWQARALIAEGKLPGLLQALSTKEQENKDLLQICEHLMASLQPSTVVTLDEPTQQDLSS